MVSHKSEVDLLCDSIMNDVDLTKFKKLHYGKLEKEDKAKIEEEMYDMMLIFMITSIDIFELIPRSLTTIID